MCFPSEHVTRTVFAFDRLPASPEKAEIAKQYTSDEISLFEFVAKAESYLKKTEAA